VGLLAGRLRLTAADAHWFDPALGILGPPKCGVVALHVADSLAPARRLAWRRTVQWFAAKNRPPGQSATLDTIRVDAGQSLDKALGDFETAFELVPGSAVAALHLNGLLTQGADLLDPQNLQYVVDAASVLRRAGAPASVLATLCGTPLGESDSLAARSLLIAKFGADLGSDGLRAAMNRLREKQRAALVEYP